MAITKTTTLGDITGFKNGTVQVQDSFSVFEDGVLLASTEQCRAYHPATHCQTMSASVRRMFPRQCTLRP